ncbi:MAG: glycine--tRNA ligase subunit beta [Holosporales bacterium]|jgi:glycyl-tRNA synthetase beta chain|nr:glycine--tRNA ligase subunit beta [Holosporales bacterium]
MLQELVLEIFSEEIPAKYQKDALKDSKILMNKILLQYGAGFDKIESYISTRRVALHVTGLLPKTLDVKTLKRGPKLSAPNFAIDGFLKANNKTNNDLLENDGYFYLNVLTEGTNIKEILQEIIEQFIAEFPWKKTMHWYVEEIDELSGFWIRPIRSILCIYNDEPIKIFIKSVGIHTSNITYGHRFLSKNPIEVNSFEDYEKKLEEAYVMIDYMKKVGYIDIEIAKMAAEKGISVEKDENLLYEVAGLVDFPFIYVGTIEEKFMRLPKEVLSTSMKVHQKYFTLTYPNGVIAPFYGTVTNIPGTKTMFDGLDRVLRARLSDAAFFFKEDTEISLDAFAQRLSSVIFHEKLGTIGQKVDRMLSIAETKEENRAISLCKADLVTQMVSEFPELQGIMGAIYAEYQEEDLLVANAIMEHYKPNGASDNMPLSNIAARIAFFDKLDTIVGFIGIGIYPTGSKDPFALRRCGFSVIRLICDSEFNVLNGEKFSYFVKAICNAYSEQGIAIENDAAKNIISFVNDRFKSYVEDKLAIGYQFIDTIVESSDDEEEFDYKEAMEKAKKLEEFSKHKDFEIAQNAYKRAIGFIPETIPKNTGEMVFESEYLTKLHNFIEKNQNTDFEEMIEISKLVLDACDNVFILDKNKSIRDSNILVLNNYVRLIKKTVGGMVYTKLNPQRN